MTRRKKSQFYTDYMRERRRIQSTLRRYRSKGYDVDISLPDIPKRITQASVRRLKAITTKKIRENTYTADLDTGERITYQQFKNRYRKAKSPKKYLEAFNLQEQGQLAEIPKSWQLALDQLESIISNYEDRMEEFFREKLKLAISTYGEKEVGMAVEKMIERGEIVSAKDSYNYQLILTMSTRLMQYLQLSSHEWDNVLNNLTSYQDEQEEYEGEYNEWI